VELSPPVSPGPPADEWLTVAQVAPLLGLSDSRIQRLLRAGQLAGRKVGRDWIVSREAVEAFLAAPPGRPGHPRVAGR
jgi:excisionase family DNA binding protein